MTQNLSFIHRFEPGTSTAAPLLLLHGTGGDETDLLPLGKALAPDRALLSPRGKVLENGMPRFFRRLAEGVFDEQDVIKRAHELADFIAEAGKAYTDFYKGQKAERDSNRSQREPLRKELEQLVPSPQRRSFTWLYMNTSEKP